MTFEGEVYRGRKLRFGVVRACAIVQTHPWSSVCSNGLQVGDVDVTLEIEQLTIMDQTVALAEALNVGVVQDAATDISRPLPSPYKNQLAIKSNDFDLLVLKALPGFSEAEPGRASGAS